MPFSPKYIFVGNAAPSNSSVYLSHLSNIKSHISPKFYIESVEILNSIAKVSPIIEYNIGDCLKPQWVLANHTFSNNPNLFGEILRFEEHNFDKSTSFIQDTYKAVSTYAINSEFEKLKIVFPNINHTSYLMGYMSELGANNKSIIYFPFTNTLNKFDNGAFVHELTHCALDEVFNPYRSDDLPSRDRYHNAVKEVTKSVFSFFNGTNALLKTVEMIHNKRSIEEFVKTCYWHAY